MMEHEEPLDTIQISNIRCMGRHGAYPHEKAQAQPFEAVLTIHADLFDAQQSDSLQDTVDYSALYKTVVTTIEQESFNLLEHLGAEILVRILKHSRVAEASISLAKPGLLDGATASVTLTRAAGVNRPGARGPA